MRMNNFRTFAALAAMSMATMETEPVESFPYPEPPPGSAKNRPSGSTPVPGGGAKERARRLAKMSKQET